MQRSFQVGQQYRDTGSYRDPDDQFLRWIRGPLNSGIKNTGGIRDLGAAHSETPAALVLVSNDSGTLVLRRNRSTSPAVSSATSELKNRE